MDPKLPLFEHHPLYKGCDNRVAFSDLVQLKVIEIEVMFGCLAFSRMRMSATLLMFAGLLFSNTNIFNSKKTGYYND